MESYVLFYSNGLAVWHGLPNTRHIEINKIIHYYVKVVQCAEAGVVVITTLCLGKKNL